MNSSYSQWSSTTIIKGKYRATPYKAHPSIQKTFSSKIIQRIKGNIMNDTRFVFLQCFIISN